MLLGANNSPLRIIGRTRVAGDMLSFLRQESIEAEIVSFEQAQQEANNCAYQYIVGVVRNLDLRQQIISWLGENRLHCPSFLHPSSYAISPNEIGPGTVIYPMATLLSSIGSFCFMGSGCHVGHNTSVSDRCIQLVKSTICGSCYLAPGTILQTSAVVLDKIRISVSDVNILPLSVVSRNVETVGTYGGNPARRINNKCTFDSAYFQ